MLALLLLLFSIKLAKLYVGGAPAALLSSTTSQRTTQMQHRCIMPRLVTRQGSCCRRPQSCTALSGPRCSLRGKRADRKCKYIY